MTASSQETPSRATTSSSFSIPEFIPINPLRTSSGALAELISQFGEQGAQPVPLPSQDTAAALNNFKVINNSLSISVAASLGLGTIFKGSVAANEKAFYLDAMTYTDKYAENPLPGGGIYATRWGVGLRVLLRVQDLAANASLNFGLVGAAVELKQASAQYEISGVGIGIDGLIAVLEEVPALGDFKYETYLKINGSIALKLAKYIRDNQNTMQPQPVAVAVAKAIDPILSARSIYFAVRKISDRRSLNEALTGAPLAIDRDTVRTTYAVIAQVQNDTEKPSKDAEDRAEQWLRA